MKFHNSPTAHTILHIPYLISNLLKWIRYLDCISVANDLMMQVITVPTWSSASYGDVSFVALFTDIISHPTTFNANDISKIVLLFLLLCVIISSGKSFKFHGGFCFMLSHFAMVANPCTDFYSPYEALDQVGTVMTCIIWWCFLCSFVYWCYISPYHFQRK